MKEQLRLLNLNTKDLLPEIIKRMFLKSILRFKLLKESKERLEISKLKMLLSHQNLIMNQSFRVRWVIKFQKDLDFKMLSLQSQTGVVRQKTDQKL